MTTKANPFDELTASTIDELVEYFVTNNKEDVMFVLDELFLSRYDDNPTEVQKFVKEFIEVNIIDLEFKRDIVESYLTSSRHLLATFYKIDWINFEKFCNSVDTYQEELFRLLWLISVNS